MSMDWTAFLTDDEPTAAAAPLESELPTLPDGTHVGEIKVALIKQNEWAKHDTNPNGECLTVKIAVAKFKPIWESIPCHYAGKVAALCRSARIEPPTKANPKFDEGTLVGQFVTIETTLAISKKGNEFVKVERFRPSTAALPAELKKAAPRTNKVDAPAKEAAPDDLPF
jgi:hypothetical protein